MGSGDAADSSRVTLTRTQHVTEAEAADIDAIAATARVIDGVSPLDDQVRTELAFGARPGPATSTVALMDSRRSSPTRT